MNPIHYVATHWHAMVIGAIAWHFVGPMLTSTVMGVVSPPKQGS